MQNYIFSELYKNLQTQKITTFNFARLSSASLLLNNSTMIYNIFGATAFNRHNDMNTPSLRHIIGTIALLASAVGATAQTGRTAYDFLNIPTSAHAYGLGGSGIAIIDDDVTLSAQNPALLGPENDKQIGVNYMHYMGSGNFAGARIALAAGERGAWSAGIRYLNYGSIDGYLPDGTPTGSFSPQDISFEGAYSHDITDRWRGGISLKMIYSNYEDYNAFALAADLGVNYYNEENDLSFSVVLANMGGQLKRFESSYDRLPFDIQLGYMQGLGTSDFSLAITARNLTHWKLPYYTHPDNNDQVRELKSTFFSNFFRHLTFGLQYTPTDKFYIDLGYNYKMRTDMSTYQRNFLSGFSAGLGIKAKAFRVDVAYAMPHKSASTIMLNLGLNLTDLLH